MSPTMFKFVKAIEKFVNEIGLKGHYQVGDDGITMRFYDSVRRDLESKCYVTKKELYRTVDIECLAKRIVGSAARDIKREKQKDEIRNDLAPKYIPYDIAMNQEAYRTTMNKQTAFFIVKVNTVAATRSLRFDYEYDHELRKIKMRFADFGTGRYHAEISVCEDTARCCDPHTLADQIVARAVHEIEKLKKEESEKCFMYVSPGRSGGKTLVNDYIKNDIKFAKRMVNTMINSVYGIPKNSIKDVIFNPPATIVMWKDGSKTVVKAQNDETFDPEKGLAMAIAKKALGNQGNYFETIKKYTETYKPVKQEVVSDVSKSKGERWGVYVDGHGWVKGRKYKRMNGKKVFDRYTFTDNESEALTWKTMQGANVNSFHLLNARTVHMGKEE